MHGGHLKAAHALTGVVEFPQSVLGTFLEKK